MARGRFLTQDVMDNLLQIIDAMKLATVCPDTLDSEFLELIN